jgi:hypothetical protein
VLRSPSLVIVVMLFWFAKVALSGPADLDAAIDAIAPEVKKWASVCVVTTNGEGTPEFTWQQYGETGEATDFWPASTIKLYAAIAALELLEERDLPLETTAIFEHREADGPWVVDCARTMREMLHAVFRRSSNEDYTLLLRLVGIDRINTHFLIPQRGFPHSALMRGYVLGRPYGYVREEAQRITLRGREGRIERVEHTWSGRFYAQERGGTIIDARTGNVTSARELAECLRRVIFHEHLPPAERYEISAEALAFLRFGGAGLSGLETKEPASSPLAWKDAADAVFPAARFFHKCGVISNYALDLAFVDDAAETGKRFIVVPVVAAGSASKPESGELLVSRMARVISEWVKAQ